MKRGRDSSTANARSNSNSNTSVDCVVLREFAWVVAILVSSSLSLVPVSHALFHAHPCGTPLFTSTPTQTRIPTPALQILLPTTIPTPGSRMRRSALSALVLPDHVEALCQTYSYCLGEHQVATQSATAGLFAGLGDILAQKTTIPPTTTTSSSSSTSSTSSSSDTSILLPPPMQQQQSPPPPLPYDARRTAHFVLKGLGGGILWNAWFQMSDPLSLEITDSILQNSLSWMVSSSAVSSAPEPVAATIAALVESSSGATDAGGLVDDSFWTNNNDPAATQAASLLPIFQQSLRVLTCIVLEQCLVCPLFYTIWDIPVPALLRGSPVRQLPAQVRHKLGPLLVANAQVWTPANLITYNLPVEYRLLFASATDLIWQVACSRITTSEIELGIPPTSVLLSSQEQQYDRLGTVAEAIPDSDWLQADDTPASASAATLSTFNAAAPRSEPDLRLATAETTGTTVGDYPSKSLRPVLAFETVVGAAAAAASSRMDQRRRQQQQQQILQ